MRPDRWPFNQVSVGSLVVLHRCCPDLAIGAGSVMHAHCTQPKLNNVESYGSMSMHAGLNGKLCPLCMLCTLHPPTGRMNHESKLRFKVRSICLPHTTYKVLAQVSHRSNSHTRSLLFLGENSIYLSIIGTLDWTECGERLDPIKLSSNSTL